MTARNGYRVAQKRHLTEEERRGITELAATCNAFEGLDLKLTVGMSSPGADEDGNDFLCYANADAHTNAGADAHTNANGDGMLVGYCCLDPDGRGKVEVCGMVHPDYRRRGIGQALLAAATTVYTRRGAMEALLICEDTSASGRAFVAAIGARYRFSEHRMYLDAASFQRRPPAEARLALQPAEPRDVDALAHILSASFGDPEEETRRMVAHDIDAPDQQYYLARLEGRPVGTLKTYITDGAAYIYAFGVLPAYRGRGLGRQILAQTVETLLAAGYTRVGLEVAVENDHALGLYHSCGFRDVTTYGYYALTEVASD